MLSVMPMTSIPEAALEDLEFSPGPAPRDDLLPISLPWLWTLLSLPSALLLLLLPCLPYEEPLLLPCGV